MVRPDGFEPPTLCSEDRCSNPLSYGRVTCLFYHGIRYNKLIMPQIRNFDDAHKLLKVYAERAKQSGSYSLDRMRAVLSELGNPQDSYKTVHVAGTSGKSSTCYYITSLLIASGAKVGLTVSPHVDEVNERVQVNLVPLSEKRFCSQLQRFIDLIDKTGAELTYFELLVSFAFWEFAQQKVDYAVVEVGLGGLLDGTNVVHRPDKVCVITDIGLDHTNVLGKTISAIAEQKAGIIQDHNPVFMYQQSQDVMAMVKARCAQEHAFLHTVDEEPDEQDFKHRNYNLAEHVFEFITERDNLKMLSKADFERTFNLNIPARMEVVDYKGKTIVIDASHNGQKMGALVKGIKNQFPQASVAALVSFVAGDAHKPEEALQELHELTDEVIVTSFKDMQDTPKKSLDTKEIADNAKRAGFSNIKVVEDPVEAFQELLAHNQDILLVTGSFYLLNHIRPLLKN